VGNWLWTIGIFSWFILLVVVYSVFLSEDARGRRRYGADRWAQMKEEERRKWEREDAEEEKRQEEAKRIRREQDAAIKLCPVCSKPMTKDTYDGFTIDPCPEGHGTWLDHKELEEITGEWDWDWDEEGEYEE
jgi:hypothetical protein